MLEFKQVDGRTDEGEQMSVLNCETYGYSLVYFPDSLQDIDDRIFLFKTRIGEHRKKTAITGRDLRTYHPRLQDLADYLSESIKVVEVGAGMGDFIPVISQNGKIDRKPVVVDPANYELMAEMLKRFRYMVKKQEHLWRLEELIRRCGIILDSSRVSLVNKTLGNALASGDVSEEFDVVVDNYGMVYWHETEGIRNPFAARMLLSRLAKEGGVAYDKHIAYQKVDGELRVIH